eukprot:364939-Chlamydomonas_euryale.AAC.3
MQADLVLKKTGGNPGPPPLRRGGGLLLARSEISPPLLCAVVTALALRHLTVSWNVYGTAGPLGVGVGLSRPATQRGVWRCSARPRANWPQRASGPRG